MKRDASEAQALIGELLPGWQGEAARWVVLAAHPDDETIGASWVLAHAPQVFVVHATDGAPRAPALRSNAAPREVYAAVRAREAEAAFRVASLDAEVRQCLGFVDQEAALRLDALTWAVVGMLDHLEPDVLVVHPYEGGHPDHDACAFAASAAVRLLAARRLSTPVLLEMTSYHRGEGTLRVGEFLPAATRGATRGLFDEDRTRKQAMLAAFASQATVLAPFPCDRERYRLAPTYDFSAPPHPGVLQYEAEGWPLDGRRWRALAASTLASLGLAGRRLASREAPC